MKCTSTIDRLARMGGDKWTVYKLADQMVRDGADVIELAIGEPDVPAPDYLVDAAIDALRDGRTNYASGAGEPALRQALAERYTRLTRRTIATDQVLCFPGTQTALYAVIRAIAGPGDEILVGDPMYATYESVILSSGASMVATPLRPENGFRILAGDLASRITPATTAIFLNTPHNPTGAVLTKSDIAEIGALARKHDLWLLVDEVYEEMVFDGATFHSPFAENNLADRVIVVSSISKSHAAPGFRSGWCVGPSEFCAQLLPLSEAILFGNQPFIADATALAVAAPSPVAPAMCARFAARADRLADLLHRKTGLTVHKPEAGMFALINVSATGMSGADFAMDLLQNGGVGVMPGASFGAALKDWIRVSLTEQDDRFDAACQRIVDHATAREGRLKAAADIP